MVKSTESMNPAVKCITVTVCSRVSYCNNYVASPAINLSLLISNKSSLWWASLMLESDLFGIVPGGKIAILGSFLPLFPPSSFFWQIQFNPGHMKCTLHPLIWNWSLSPTHCQAHSCLALTKILSLKAWLVLQFGKCFTCVIFWMPFVPDSLLESRIFKWTETRCAVCQLK